MTQAFIDAYLKRATPEQVVSCHVPSRPEKMNASVQTETIIWLTNRKLARVYYSDSYKDYVLAFNFSNCKKFIITRPMWHIFRNKFKRINKILGDNVR